MRPQRFDLIAFDWDGTLFDSTACITRAIQRAAVDLGCPEPSERDASYVIGLSLYEGLAHAVPSLARERYAELGQRYRHHYFAAQHEIVLFPGTVDMLAALKARHHWLTVATGKPRNGLNVALTQAGLTTSFDGSRCADETAGKPDPQMLLELMREFGAEPERTLMIGDTTHDLQMARNAGVPAVAVSFGAHGADELRAFEPLFVADSTAALHDWLLANA